jgi:hypothetical protein
LNKSLIAFAVILIVGGIYVGIGLIVLLGVILLIPGLLTTPKQPSKVPVSKAPPPRRTSPPPAAQPAKMEYSQAGPMQPQAPASAPTTMYVPSVSPMSSGPIYSPALFPTSMFPSLSVPTTYRPQILEHKEGRTSETDELLEFGLLIAVLRLASS